jgi:hypothetical protein
MKQQFLEILAGAITASGYNLRLYAKQHERQMRSLKCVDPEIGYWVDTIDGEFLVEALPLKNRKLAAQIHLHVETCQRCQEKIVYDIELGQHMDKALREHKEQLSEVFYEDEELREDLQLSDGMAVS